MKQHASFSVINDIVTLLKVGEKTKQSLMSLLANKCNNHEVDQAIKTAIDVKLIRKAGMISATSHFKQAYKLA